MLVYKLTDQNDETQKGTKWGPGISHAVDGQLVLCENGIHAYTDPLLAVLHNPIHGQFNLETAHLWRCEASDEHISDGLKILHRSLTTIERVEIPSVSTTQAVAYGILCALEAHHDPNFAVWAQNWLSGFNRTESAAMVIEAVAWEAEEAAAFSAARAAARVAEFSAARAAARAAAVAGAGAGAVAASESVLEAAYTAGDLLSIAKKAMEVK